MFSLSIITYTTTFFKDFFVEEVEMMMVLRLFIDHMRHLVTTYTMTTRIDDKNSLSLAAQNQQQLY